MSSQLVTCSAEDTTTDVMYCALEIVKWKEKQEKKEKASICLDFAVFCRDCCCDFSSRIRLFHLAFLSSHIHFICIPAVHIISFCVSFLLQVNELNKLAGSQCMGYHSSAGRALQRERRGLGLNPLKPRKTLFLATSQLLKLRFTAIHFIYIPAVHILSF